MRGDASRTGSHSASSVSWNPLPGKKEVDSEMYKPEVQRANHLGSPPKLGEKAREQRDRAQRDAQNQQYAGSTYHIPAPDDILADDGDLSGLPWGGINMRHVVARGHASASSHHSHHSGGSGARRSSSGTTTRPPAPADVVDHALYNMNPYGYAHPGMGMGGFDARGGGDGSSSVTGGADSTGYYDSPYGGGGYYDFDTTTSGSGGGGHHQM